MLLILAFIGCGLQFDAVSISPIYGWVDGCNTVTIAGHGFGDDVTATIGANAVTDIVLPTNELDRGFRFDAVVPTGAAPGLYDVTVTTGGVSSVITGSGGYTYVACPARGTIDAVGASSAGAGASVEMTGCSLDVGLKMQFIGADGVAVGDPAPLTSACGTARTTFTVPAVPDGAYYVTLVDEAGTTVSGGICPPPDTADTAAPVCVDHPFTVGAAR
jgi:hypothetical protein